MKLASVLLTEDSYLVQVLRVKSSSERRPTRKRCAGYLSKWLKLIVAMHVEILLLAHGILESRKSISKRVRRAWVQGSGGWLILTMELH